MQSDTLKEDQQRVQIDHLAAALKWIVPIQQEVPPGRRRHTGDRRHGLGCRSVSCVFAGTDSESLDAFMDAESHDLLVGQLAI